MNKVCSFKKCTFDATYISNVNKASNRKHKNKKNISLNNNLIDSLILNNKKIKKRATSSLTEIKTLSKHLRFRRQSIRQIKTSLKVF